MTALTPQQMRELAGEAEMYLPKASAEVMARNAAALRTAADQLETLTIERDALRAQRDELTQRILTADTAPQEPAPSKKMLMTHPHDGHGPDDTCRDCEAKR